MSDYHSNPALSRAMSELDHVAACKECGGMLCWISSHRPAKEIAKEVADWIRRGFDLQRMATEDVRKASWDHAATCSKARKADKQKELIT